MNPKDVAAIISQIAELMSPAAQEAWRLAVREAYLRGALNAFWAFAGLAMLLMGTRGLIGQLRLAEGDWDEVGGMAIVRGFLIFVGAFLFPVAGSIAFGYFANPQMRAILLLLGTAQ